VGKALSLGTPAGSPKRRKRRQRRSVWREYGLPILVAAGLALVVRVFFVQAYRIPSRSMEDSLLVGDFLLVDKYTYGALLPLFSWRLPGFAPPAQGDVVVFLNPVDQGKVYIKRCIATGGQVVEIRNKVVYVDGIRLPDPPFSKYVDARVLPAIQGPRDNHGPVQLAAGELFVMGDNRDNSRDSRHWGKLSGDLVIGKAMCIYWSREPNHWAGHGAAGSGVAGLAARAVDWSRRIRWHRLGDWIR
jgi:signal peptidase I